MSSMELFARVEGVYYDGSSSEARPRDLLIHSDGSVVLVARDTGTPQEIESLSYDQLTVSSRVGNTPRYITFPNQGRFETRDNATIDQWQRHFDRSWLTGLAHYLEMHQRFVVAGVVVVLLSVFLTVKYLIPAASTFIAERLPLAVSQKMGEHTLEFLDQHLFSESQLPAERRRQLQTLFSENFASEIEAFNLSLHFRFSESIGANAFALPSGDLIFTDAIVNLAQSDEELLSVMAHEVGHLEQRHMLRRVVQNSMLVFILTMISGDASSSASVVVAAPTLFLEMAYSRKFEREADDYALHFMREKNIDPVHFANMMARMEWSRTSDCEARSREKNRADVDEADEELAVMIKQLQYFLSSHPAYEERIESFGKPTVHLDPVADCSKQ